MSRHGAALVGVAAVRRRPSHAAEQVTQVLFGETYRVLGTAGGGEWLRVRLDADGYQGWVRAWHGVPLSAVRAAAWRRGATLRVRRLMAVVRSHASERSQALVVVPWATRLVPLRKTGNWWKVGLPDGRTGYFRAGDAVRRNPPGGALGAAAVERTAQLLLGVPYEWGGRSSWGMDCSGFVQAVMAWHGIPLPRDAWRQAESLGVKPASKLRERIAAPAPGEGIFFGPRAGRISHVGLGGRGGRLYHALGQVRVDLWTRAREPLVKKLLKRFAGASPPAWTARQSRQFT